MNATDTLGAERIGWLQVDWIVFANPMQLDSKIRQPPLWGHTAVQVEVSLLELHQFLQHIQSSNHPDIQIHPYIQSSNNPNIWIYIHPIIQCCFPPPYNPPKVKNHCDPPSVLAPWASLQRLFLGSVLLVIVFEYFWSPKWLSKLIQKWQKQMPEMLPKNSYSKTLSLQNLSGIMALVFLEINEFLDTINKLYI